MQRERVAGEVSLFACGLVMNGDCYLFQGHRCWRFVGRSSEKAAEWTLRASEAASDEVLKLGPRPLVSFLGIHSQNLQLDQQIAEELSGGIDSLHIQVPPVDPQRDSTDKLVGLLDLLTGLEHAGRTVIGGHLGTSPAAVCWWRRCALAHVEDPRPRRPCRWLALQPQRGQNIDL